MLAIFLVPQFDLLTHGFTQLIIISMQYSMKWYINSMLQRKLRPKNNAKLPPNPTFIVAWHGRKSIYYYNVNKKSNMNSLSTNIKFRHFETYKFWIQIICNNISHLINHQNQTKHFALYVSLGRSNPLSAFGQNRDFAVKCNKLLKHCYMLLEKAHLPLKIWNCFKMARISWIKDF